MPTNVATFAALQTAAADTGISSILATTGFAITGLVIARSDLTIDFGSHTFTFVPAASEAAITFHSVANDAGFDGIGQSGSPTRTSSLLTGTITAAGTTLQMHDEVQTLSPGDVVSIACGVNTLDPAEPYITLVMTVSSVTGPVSGTYTIHFTAAFGVDVPTYTNATDLKSHVAPAFWYKIQPTGSYGQWFDNDGSLTVAPWTTQANFTKGLGTSHGMTTFAGGKMNSNVTLKKCTLNTTLPSGTASGFMITANDVFGFTFQDSTLNNIWGVGIFAFRSHQHTVSGVTITGSGRGSFAGTDSTIARAFASWGGTVQTYSNITWDHTTNIDGFNFEVAEADFSADTLTFDTIKFDNTGVDQKDAFIFGFFGAQTGSWDITNCTFSTDAGSDNSSLSWVNLGQLSDFNNLTVAMANLPIGMNIGDDSQTYGETGTLEIGGETFGPAATVHKTGAAAIFVPANSGSYRWIRMPRGIYRSMRLRLTTVGNCFIIADRIGNSYSTTLNTWTSSKDAGHSWGVIQPGVPDGSWQRWPEYEDGTHWLQIYFNGSSSAIIEIEVDYLPLVAADTSRDWLVVDPPVLLIANDTGGGGGGMHTDNAVAFLDLDSDSTDDSGNGHSGTDTAMSYNGTKATFNGSSSQIQIAAFDGGAHRTYALWMNCTALPAGGQLAAIIDRRAVTNNEFALYLKSDGTLQVLLYDQGGGQLCNVTTSGAISTGVLTHIVVTNDGSNLYIYLQGSLDASTPATATGSAGYQTSEPLFLGAENGTRFFNGTFQSFIVRNVYSDATWVTEDRNGGTPQKWAQWQAAPLAAGTLAEVVHASTTASLTYATVTDGTPPYSNQLRRSLTSGSGYSDVESPVVGNTAAYNETSLTPATDYYYVVLTTDGASQTATSNEVHIKTAVAPPTDVQPTRPTSAYMPSFPRIHGIVTKRPMAEKE